MKKLMGKLQWLIFRFLDTCEVCWDPNRKGTQIREIKGIQKWTCRDCSNYLDGLKKYETMEILK